VAAVGPLGRRYGSVLVVDDEDTVRTLIADALSDAGYRVFEAVDGPSALALLEADTHLDLMISDIGLPGGLNGRELAAAVRAQRPTTKILLVTGYSEAATLAQAEKEDRLKVLVKPFSIEALKGQVGTLMDAS
jgi:CheY-like chemotaxis protein